MSAEFLMSKKLFKLLSPVLGLEGRPIKKLSVHVDVDGLVEIETVEYVRMDPSKPVTQPNLELLNKLIALVEVYGDQTQTR